MDCAQTRNCMHGYLDGELDPIGSAGVEEHVKSCAACEDALKAHSALRAALRQSTPYHRAPDGLANRIRSEARRVAGDIPAKPHLFNWRPLQFGAAMAATAAFTWIAAIHFSGSSVEEAVAAQVISGHLRSVISGRLTDVTSSDQHTVKPWLSSKLDFSPPVTDLTTAGFPLVGGRLDYVENRPVAVLVYRHRQHTIDLFVVPKAGSGESASMRKLSKNGYHLLGWIQGGMAFWAISDLNPLEMEDFARVYAAAE